ncbi:MAG: hypothetical protein NW224_16065, partial [Leptolyngbyaceae cyanobacterium bins.302]|nr:hypothetical protein [Leptolyngbyaceae cyanobacterium bins.302]
MKASILPALISGLVCLWAGAAWGGEGGTFSGAVTYTSPSKATTSITGQIVLPNGMYFSGPGTVTYQNNGGQANTDSFLPTELTINPGTAMAVPANSSISAQAAAQLQVYFNSGTEADLQRALAVIRAAGGADG